MKRGFLTTTKAKLLAEKTGVGAGQAEMRFAHMPAGFDSKLSYGKIAQAGRPEGYEAQTLEFGPNAQISRGDFTGYDDDQILTTTLPSVSIHAKPSDVPGGYTECMVSGYVKRIICATPGFPQPPPQPKGPKAYRVTEIPGKGLGVVATRDLKANELVMSERALLIAPAAPRIALRLPDTFTHEQIRQAGLHEREKMMEPLLYRMDEEYKKQYMALHNSHLEDGSGPLIGIVRTNSFEISGLYDRGFSEAGGREGGYLGVFNVLSRVNHSCSPNLSRVWDMPSFSMVVYASQDIPAGSELCISYISPSITPASARQTQLAPYGFSCTCAACVGPRSAASDALRARMHKMAPNVDAMIRAWATNRSLPDDHLLKKALEDLAAVESEGLQQMTVFHDLLFLVYRCYVVLGDEENIKKFGKKIAATAVMQNGLNGKESSLMVMFGKVEIAKRDMFFGARKRRVVEAKVAEQKATPVETVVEEGEQRIAEKARKKKKKPKKKKKAKTQEAVQETSREADEEST
ncbi:hypothetical protein HGRIS_014483 [Hohenbuehelia grisea]|uniref:SET domain-containing protein n=1 Tax=Hohenbuehelia grisea TaxID=104357 RepID=A0ABR3JTN8_9AGAR